MDKFPTTCLTCQEVVEKGGKRKGSGDFLKFTKRSLEHRVSTKKLAFLCRSDFKCPSVLKVTCPDSQRTPVNLYLTQIKIEST